MVLYLEDDSGAITKVKVEGFPSGTDGIRDPDNLDLEGFVADNYPGLNLVATTVKAGNNANPAFGPGEGQLIILDDAKSESDLPMADHVSDENTLQYADTLGDYVIVGGGGDDTFYEVNISSGLTDTDGSESLSVTIGNVPQGVTFSAGTNNDDGTWTLAAGDLPGVVMTVPDSVSGDFSLAITATSTEASNADTASTSTSLSVDVNEGATIVGDGAEDLLEDAAFQGQLAATDADGNILTFSLADNGGRRMGR